MGLAWLWNKAEHASHSLVCQLLSETTELWSESGPTDETINHSPVCICVQKNHVRMLKFPFPSGLWKHA